MGNLWKILVPIGVVVIVAAIMLARPRTTVAPTTSTIPLPQYTTESGSGATTASTPETSAIVVSGLPAADALVADMLQDSVSEQSTFTAETNDSALVANDSQDLTNLGKTYDTGSF